MATRKVNLTAPDWFFIDSYSDEQYDVYFGERTLSDKNLSDLIASFTFEQDAIDYVEWQNDLVASGVERERTNQYDDTEDEEGLPVGYDNEANWEEYA